MLNPAYGMVGIKLAHGFESCWTLHHGLTACRCNFSPSDYALLPMEMLCRGERLRSDKDKFDDSFAIFPQKMI